ncbi:MAG: efflux RND transporter periplasmic adaptor subunit [Pseudomonadota bacterium]
MTKKEASGLKTTHVATGAILALIILLLYLLGVIGGDKVQPGTVALKGTASPGETLTVAVEKNTVDDLLAWPGTVRSRTVTGIASKITARISEIRVTAGNRIAKGGVVAVLDQRELKASAREAQGTLAAAKAEMKRAIADERRTRELFAKEAATRQTLESVIARSKSAQGEVTRAANALTQIRVNMDEAILAAPFDGVIVKRLKEPGDMALPGEPVVLIQDPEGLRLESLVPTSCAGNMAVGVDATIRIDVLGVRLAGRIDEIEPEADPETRTVLVKVALPAANGLRPGLFGWLEQACGRHEALLIPSAAVRRIGQIETVRVLIDGAARMRHIRTGKVFGDKIEALSGLREGEAILFNNSPRQP